MIRSNEGFLTRLRTSYAALPRPVETQADLFGHFEGNETIETCSGCGYLNFNRQLEHRRCYKPIDLYGRCRDVRAASRIAPPLIC
jgi:hypothetical protein